VIPLPTRLRNYFFARNRKDPAAEELPWLRTEDLWELHAPRPIVVVNGGFDLLHAAHMRLIFAARDKAGPKGTLVCALDADSRIRAAKGAQRPILSFVERATTLGYMPIDYLVEIASDDDMAELMCALEPDLRVQGGDYKGHATKFPEVPKMFVANRGLHTSEIVRRIATATAIATITNN
jgi:bifunctional ADP-heptose synthase (sugar kinase/adenylyltransferase)